MKKVNYRKCRICGTRLSVQNMPMDAIKGIDNVCKKCDYIKMKQYNRKHLIDSDVRIYGTKRDYPLDNCCEVCKRTGRKLAYHHWQNSNLQLGVWICLTCHKLAHGVDEGYLNNYLQIREKILGCTHIGVNQEVTLLKES